MAWKEFYSYETTFTNLPAGTGVTYTDNEVRIDTDADFEFIKTMFFPITTRVRIKYRDDTNGRFLMKGSQDLRTIGGHAVYSMAPGGPTPPGFVPYIWPRPYIIPAATTFAVSVADFSSLITSPRIAFHGSKLRQGESPWEKKFRAVVPYVYPITSAIAGTIAVAANRSTPSAIPTDNDAHFLVLKLVGARTGSCELTIKDGGRDRQWMNQAVHFDNLIGNGHYPNILTSPRFIPRGSTIQVVVNDLSGLANTVELNFVGVKLYE